MGGHNTAFGGGNNPTLNQRTYPEQVSRRRDQEQRPASQDSWRSYRNDPTNLQQMANFVGSQHRECANQRNLNPAASSFQPVNQSLVTMPVRSHFTPYQPVRISNGQHERSVMPQTRLNSTATNDRGSRRYALRSSGPVKSRTSRDVPIPSIESQTRQSSSIPQSLTTPRQGLDALKEFSKRSSARRTGTSTPPPVPVPSPTQDYITQASISPVTLAEPQKLLIVVDLNGTLLKRGASRGTTFSLRPGVTPFMDYLFANHIVMIYTSSRPENAQGMVNKLFHPDQCKALAAVWARDKLDLTTEQYNSKIQVYKKLEKIWADEAIQKRAGDHRRWDQSNTILIDDSHLKALAQPYNLLRVEEFLNDKPAGTSGNRNIANKQQLDALNAWSKKEQQIIKDLEAKLESLKWTQDVSRLIRQWQLADAEMPVAVNDQSSELENTQLMTPMSPKSPESNDSNSDGGVASGDVDIDELTDDISRRMAELGQTDSDAREDGASDRSVSPINEAVWKDILSGVEAGKDAPPIPKSIDG